MSTMLRHDIPISRSELDRRVAQWADAGRGPSNMPLSEAQVGLLRILALHLGQENAVRLEVVARALEGISDRVVKQLVQDLRLVHRIKVGSCRGYRRRIDGQPQQSKVVGYFLCLTPEEVLMTYLTWLHEALTTLEVCDAMTDGRMGLNRLLAETRGYIQRELEFKEEVHLRL